MRIAVSPAPSGQAWLRRLTDDGEPLEAAWHCDDLYEAIPRLEAEHDPRWVLTEVAWVYPELLHSDVRFGRCHDVGLVEALLLRAEGRDERSCHVAAAHARLHGLHEPEPPRAAVSPQDTLFDTGADQPDPRAQLDALVEVHADQRRRLRQLPTGMGLLSACESAGALIAAEMTRHGLPWRVDVHDAVLTELLGPKPVAALRPKKLQALADAVGDAFGAPLNPDSPQQVIAAFKAAGCPVETTRAWELRELDHPAVAPLLKYKELSRVWSAHGWNWLRDWVGDGPGGPDSPAKRFRPEYVVGGVVTGRWATDGGGALQIPKAVRSAAMADPGWSLVVADAAQLEPRMLAAMSADHGMIAAARDPDMYAALAPTFGGSRADAKIALLSAMYGGTAGNATALLHVMRRRFPAAHSLVEEAAARGARGLAVRTWLGRVSPPTSAGWWNALAGPGGVRAARDRGRFTRNFVVQGTAAEWALAMMALLRARLHEARLGQLVFFQHDEIIVHCPSSHAEQVAREIQSAADAATRMLFAPHPDAGLEHGQGQDRRGEVRVPMPARVVGDYAAAK